MNRRGFLRAFGIGGAAAVVAPSALRSAAKPQTKRPLDDAASRRTDDVRLTESRPTCAATSGQNVLLYGDFSGYTPPSD